MRAASRLTGGDHDYIAKIAIREECNLSRLARYSQYIRVCSLKHNVPVCTYNSGVISYYIRVHGHLSATETRTIQFAVVRAAESNCNRLVEF